MQEKKNCRITQREVALSDVQNINYKQKMTRKIKLSSVNRDPT